MIDEFSTIRPLLEFWRGEGYPDEPFSEFYARQFGSGTEQDRLVLCEAGTCPGADPINLLATSRSPLRSKLNA